MFEGVKNETRPEVGGEVIVEIIKTVERQGGINPHLEMNAKPPKRRRQLFELEDHTSP